MHRRRQYDGGHASALRLICRQIAVERKRDTVKIPACPLGYLLRRGKTGSAADICGSSVTRVLRVCSDIRGALRRLSHLPRKYIMQGEYAPLGGNYYAAGDACAVGYGSTAVFIITDRSGILSSDTASKPSGRSLIALAANAEHAVVYPVDIVAVGKAAA